MKNKSIKNTSSIINFRDKVYIYYSHCGHVLRIPCGIEWKDLDKNRNRVDKMLAKLNKIVIEYFDLEMEYPNVDYIKEKMNLITNDTDDLKSLFKLWIHKKNEESLSQKTMDLIDNSFILLCDFSEKHKININQLNDDFIRRYQTFLREDRKLADSTYIIEMGRFKEFIKWVMIYTSVKKHIINWELLCKKTKTWKTDRETLTIEELMILYSKRNTDKYRITLDLFLVQCFTSLAYVDMMRINKKLIEDGRIKIDRQKTGSECDIGINKIVEEILVEHDYNLNLMELPNYNKSIKHMLKSYVPDLPGMEELKNIKFVRNGKEFFYDEYKYNRFSSHSARRTFITINIKNGTPFNLIQLHTGQKTESIMLGYCNNKTDTKTNLGEQMINGKS